MKQSKNVQFRIIVLAILCAMLAYVGINRVWESIVVYEYWAWDFNLRRNEIACAHDGIDPLDIFDRKITSEKYCGFFRPDKPLESNNGRKYVHSYPAWHTALFWWYGFVSQRACTAIMMSLYVCALIWTCIWTKKRLFKSDTKDYIVNILFILTMTLYSLGGICWTMNYGLLLLGCILLLYTALEYKQDILAGILYSLIMIKPQIGILLFFPLFFNRKYKTIAAAVIICVLETLFTSFKLGKSPFALILQIPQIGAPFSKGIFADKIICVIGPLGQYVYMSFFILLTIVGCFLVRNAKEAWVRFLPALAFVPFWTYSQYHDWLVTLPCYIYILNSKNKYPRLYDFCFFCAILWGIVTFAYAMQWYSLGRQGISVLLHLAILFSCCLMVIFDMDDIDKYRSIISSKFSFLKKTEKQL